MLTWLAKYLSIAFDQPVIRVKAIDSFLYSKLTLKNIENKTAICFFNNDTSVDEMTKF